MRHGLDQVKRLWRRFLRPTAWWLRRLEPQAWALAGVMLGALVASSLLHAMRLENTSYRELLGILVAVVVGILAETVGVGLILVLTGVLIFNLSKRGSWERIPRLPRGGLRLAEYTLDFLPFAALGVVIYRYFSWVVDGQHSVAVDFVGGVLVVLGVIPLIKRIVTHRHPRNAL
jgi:hypothetical protein